MPNHARAPEPVRRHSTDKPDGTHRHDESMVPPDLPTEQGAQQQNLVEKPSPPGQEPVRKNLKSEASSQDEQRDGSTSIEGVGSEIVRSEEDYSVSEPATGSLEQFAMNLNTGDLERTLEQQDPTSTLSFRTEGGLGRFGHETSNLERFEPYVRQMYIVPEGVKNKSEYPLRFSQYDTMSHVCLTYADVLEGLGMQFYELDSCPNLQVLGPGLVKPIGIKHLMWYDEQDMHAKSGRPWKFDFYVLPKPANGKRLFDFLLGANFLLVVQKQPKDAAAVEQAMFAMVTLGYQHRSVFY